MELWCDYESALKVIPLKWNLQWDFCQTYLLIVLKLMFNRNSNLQNKICGSPYSFGHSSLLCKNPFHEFQKIALWLHRAHTGGGTGGARFPPHTHTHTHTHTFWENNINKIRKYTFSNKRNLWWNKNIRLADLAKSIQIYDWSISILYHMVSLKTTKLHLVVDFCVFTWARWCSMCSINRVFFIGS